MTAEICAHGTLLGYCLECSGAEVRALRVDLAAARRECDQWAIRFDSALRERDEARATVREENEWSAWLLAERDARIAVLEVALRCITSHCTYEDWHTAVELAEAALTPPTKEET